MGDKPNPLYRLSSVTSQAGTIINFICYVLNTDFKSFWFISFDFYKYEISRSLYTDWMAKYDIHNRLFEPTQNKEKQKKEDKLKENLDSCYHADHYRQTRDPLAPHPRISSTQYITSGRAISVPSQWSIQ